MQEFNKGVYDYIIATDETGADGEYDEEDEEEDEEDNEGEVEESEEREEEECQSHSDLSRLYLFTSYSQLLQRREKNPYRRTWT